ncbi:hypothetical protein [Natronococcus jeotgali]|uniref:Uncharacterized protein n=1 Tax=Natronococcus jeotgali DSM 18795 TaxID=1227498 RepID=L9XPM1_9EURY|nr:hypothetical protein [Natronococcus jeotgali]ELY62533.1 hypothetical protein C492_08055 [Natronococcus jeotgali DSM 18795]
MSGREEVKEKEKNGEDSGEQAVSSKRDLANRYQSMVADQFQSVSNFEDKAWKAIRANIALIGIYLTGLSILLRPSDSAPNIVLTDTAPILIGIVGLFASLIYAIIVLLGIKIGFGPSTDTAESLIKSELEPDEYDSIIVTNYAKTVNSNWGILEDKSNRLRKSFALLVIGLTEITLGLLFVIAPSHPRILEIKAVSFVVVSAIVGYIAYYIWTKGYESADDEEEDGLDLDRG